MQIRIAPSPCYLYILYLTDGTFYAGITNDLTRRVSEHNANRCRSTAQRVPVVDVHYHLCRTRSMARMLEVVVKNKGVAKWLQSNKTKLLYSSGTTVSIP